MNAGISILIPTFNDLCLPQVRTLAVQAERLAGVEYEIVVMDDASTDPRFPEQNSRAGELRNCRFVRNEKNVGRAAIRNKLAGQARFEWLIFLDSNIEIEDPAFLERYVAALTAENDVVCGGVHPLPPADIPARACLRYVYERSYRPKPQVDPYKSFRTTNFAIRRSTMLTVRIDERFRNFGYEDVDFGRRLRRHSARIAHISNPVVYRKYESNADYLRKIDTSLQTLKSFELELRDYSPLITASRRLAPVGPLVRLFHRLVRGAERRNLTGSRPSPIVLKAYKLGAFMSL